MKIPNQKLIKPVPRTYKNFAGVDFSSDPSNVQINRSPSCINMYKDYGTNLGQAQETRPGFINILELDSPIYAIHFLNTTGLKVLVHCGKKLLLWSNYPSSQKQDSMTVLYSNMAEVKSRSFTYNDKLYINDGANYIFYDGTKIETVKSVSFIPTTTMSRNPIGGGKIFQPVNLLQPKRKNSFVGNNTAKDYTLDTANLDSSSVFLMTAVVQGTTMTEGAGFTVNRTTGVVSFNTPPPAPLTVGQDNVIITLSKTNPEYITRIEKCLLSVIFDNRVFFSGNSKSPNALFNSQVNDPTYISDLAYYQDGSDNVPITSLLRVGDSLMVIKKDDQQDAVVYYHTPHLSDSGTTYPTKQGLAGIGCISMWGSANFLDEPVFISRLGLEGFTKLNLGLERSIEHKSSLVDGKLVNESDLQNLHITEWKGYLLCLINGNIYLADNRQRFENPGTKQLEYEWYFWDNIKDVVNIYEKKDFSGNNIQLIDSSNNDIKKISVHGKSKQEAREGYNLVNLNAESYTKNGVTVTKNGDGSYTLNGTSNRGGDLFLTYPEGIENNIHTFETIPYTLSTFVASGTANFNSKKASIACVGKTDGVSNYIIISNTLSSNQLVTTKTIATNSILSAINFYIESAGVVFNNYTIKVQLNKGSAKPYEQYGASPTPDYPAEIRSVANNVNLFDKDGQNFDGKSGYNNFMGGEGIGNGIVGGNIFNHYISNTRCKIYFKIRSNEACVLSYNSKYSIVLTGFADSAGVIVNSTLTNPFKKKDGYVCIIFRKNDSTAFTELEIEELRNSIKIEKGNVATKYTPYGFGNLEVCTSKINKIKKQSLSTSSSDKDFWYILSDFQDYKATPLTDGWLKIENLENNTTTAKYINFYIKKHNARILPNKDYTVFYEIKNKTGTFLANQDIIISDTAFKDSVFKNTVISPKINSMQENKIYKNKVTTNDDISINRCVFRSFQTIDAGSVPFSYEIRIWLADGDHTGTGDNVDYPFEMYEETTANLLLDKPLRSLSNGAKDTLNDDDTITRNVGEIVLNGSENWYDGAVLEDTVRFRLAKNDIMIKKISNITTQMNNLFGRVFYDFTETRQSFYVSENLIVAKVNKSTLDTYPGANYVEKWKAYLQTNNWHIQAELKTPVIEPLSAENIAELDNLRTFKNITNIMTDSDLQPNLEGEYASDNIIDTIDYNATLLKEYDNDLFFGTNNGVIAKFVEKRYNDNGRAIYSQFQLKSDDFGSVNHMKTTNKRGGVAKLKTLPNSVCKLKVLTDKTKEKEVARYASSGFGYNNFSYKDFSYNTKSTSYMKYKIKEKKWTEISLIFYSDELDKPFGIFDATLEAFGGRICQIERGF